MAKINIYLIFDLLLLICSVDMIHGNALKNQKQLQNNHLDKKFQRKLSRQDCEKSQRCIIPYVAEIVSYDYGFINSNIYPASRENIESIISVSSTSGKISNKNIKGDMQLDGYSTHTHFVFFQSETNTLEDIFNGEKDKLLAGDLQYLDLTNFDMSKITSFKNAFSNLRQLQSITFSKSYKLQPTNIERMLYGCERLQSLDLSMFDLSNCQNFAQIINGCTALKKLFLREFNFINDNIVKAIFSDDLELEYLDIYDASGSAGIIPNYVKNVGTIRVCQSRYIFSDQLYDCCGEVCKPNFISIYFKQACQYNSGFKNSFRLIDFKLKFDNQIINSTDTLRIDPGYKFDIYFAGEPTSLVKFFSEESDPNIDCVSSIDFSNLISTSLTNISSLFYNSGSIESITLNCNLSKVIDMSNLFDGCSSLKALYLRNFIISSGTKTTDILKGVNKLSYLEILGLNDVNNVIKKNLPTEIQSLIVCKDENLDFASENFKYICCDYDISRDRCRSTNYISIQYENSIKITKFGNNNRRELLFLMLKDQIYDLIGTFTVDETEKLELHFTHAIGSLENFFSNDLDTTSSNIKSVDFSNFDSSEVMSLSNLFKGCSSLEKINFTNFKTSKVANMVNMFEGCEKIQILNISGFNMESVTNLENMFQGLTKLGYIILKDFTTGEQFNDEISKENGLNKLNKRLLVCQDEKNKILNNEKYKTYCCNFNVEKYKCMPNNYLAVNYQKSVQYNSNFLNDYRKDVVFISIEQETIFLSENDLTIEGVIKFELDPNTKSLKNLFNYEFDNNVGEIITIDFSHLNVSLITDMDSTFKGCKSLQSLNFSKIETSSLISMSATFSECDNLESLDLSYFQTLLVTNMNNLLSNCKKLKEIDLSNFETPNVANMDYMFSGCDDLQYIDISLFNMIKTQSAFNMFNVINNLKYINLENVYYSKDFISGSPLNDTNGLLFSQKEIILGGNNNMGCYYNITSEQCESSNYIIIYYAVDTEYTGGFENNYRQNIDFIIAEDRNKKIAPLESFSIVRGNKIEIYYKDSTIIKSLQSYFDSSGDENAKYIKYVDISHLNIYLEDTSLSSLFKGCNLLESVYLSNLNTSNVTNMSSMFANCNSLKLLDLSNFDTSKVTNMDSMFAGCT